MRRPFGSLVAAFAVAAFPPYQPHHVSGVIRSWGHGFLRPNLHRWEEAFHRWQPDVRFEDKLITSAAAIAGLYSGRTNLGVLAREITPPEVAAYEKMTGQKVAAVTVMAGSLGDQDRIMALGVFVNRRNPLNRLTLAQLDAIWGAELRRGARKRIRRWEQLEPGAEGLGRIHPYSGPPGEAPGMFFSHAVMGGSVLWNEALTPFENVESEVPSTGTEFTAPQITRTVDAYQKVVDAVAADPNGIGLAGAGYRNPGAKLVALASADGAFYILPSAGTVSNFSYPLARPVKLYFNRGPHLAADPAVVEFLRFILSREGQACVRDEGHFLPLDARATKAELNRLEWSKTR